MTTQTNSGATDLIDTDEFAQLCDVIEATSAMAGRLLTPGAVGAIALSVLQLLCVPKSSPAAVLRIWSPATGENTLATGDLPNP